MRRWVAGERVASKIGARLFQLNIQPVPFGEPGFGISHCKLPNNVAAPDALVQIYCRRDFPYAARAAAARSIVLPASGWLSAYQGNCAISHYFATSASAPVSPLYCAVAQLEPEGELMPSIVTKTTHARRAPAESTLDP